MKVFRKYFALIDQNILKKIIKFLFIFFYMQSKDYVDVYDNMTGHVSLNVDVYA